MESSTEGVLHQAGRSWLGTTSSHHEAALVEADQSSKKAAHDLEKR